MIIHFIASSQKAVTNISSYRAIVNAIHAQGAMLAADWVEPAYIYMKEGRRATQEHWENTYQEHIEALARSDIVIAEVSDSSFGAGFQVATAIQQKKPILLLIRKNKAEEGTFNVGVNNSFVSKNYYDEDNIESIVAKFIKDNTIETKDLRFNFFIDREIYNYLRWTALRTGTTKAEILRKLVTKEIERKNED